MISASAASGYRSEFINDTPYPICFKVYTQDNVLCDAMPSQRLDAAPILAPPDMKYVVNNCALSRHVVFHMYCPKAMGNNHYTCEKGTDGGSLIAPYSVQAPGDHSPYPYKVSNLTGYVDHVIQNCPTLRDSVGTQTCVKPVENNQYGLDTYVSICHTPSVESKGLCPKHIEKALNPNAITDRTGCNEVLKHAGIPIAPEKPEGGYMMCSDAKNHEGNAYFPCRNMESAILACGGQNLVRYTQATGKDKEERYDLLTSTDLCHDPSTQKNGSCPMHATGYSAQYNKHLEMCPYILESLGLKPVPSETELKAQKLIVCGKDWPSSCR